MQTITTPASIYTPPATALIQKVQLRIFESCPSATLCLMQYDRALPVIAVELFEGGNPYKVPENAAVNIRMVKPDKTTVYNPALGVSSDRKTTYIGITPQMTACYGNCTATLEIVLNDGVLGTGLLHLNIEKNPVSEDAVESSDEYLSLQEIVNKVQTYADQASAAAESAEAAAESAMRAVQSDFAENNENAASYVKNRPFYLAPGEVLVQEQTFAVTNDELNVRIDGDFTLVPGKMYEVTFDGEPYDCFAYTASVSGGTVLGDLGVNPDANMEGENRGGGEPFAVIAGTNGVWLYTETKGEFRIKIADPEGEGNTVVIDERYRGAFGVNADWTQNDPTAPDYIKNRPFYGEKAGIAETITTEESGGYGYGEITGELLLEAGKTYSVTLDGNAYECKAYTIENSGGADTYTALGNSALAVQDMPEAENYPDATDEPFSIVDWGGGDLSLYTEEAGTYAVELGEKGGFARMDEKYLPLTVLLTTAQQLTEKQQAQVRENIGVGKGGGSGNDGFSPIATVERTATGAVITITDKTGTTEAEIKDGEDGVSPSVSISKTGKVTTIEITDADGTQAEEIVDGEDGKDGVGIAYVEDPQDGTMEVYGTNGDLLGVVTLPKGKDGKTPVKGEDYLTAADKAELVDAVIAALPDASEVSY